MYWKYIKSIYFFNVCNWMNADGEASLLVFSQSKRQRQLIRSICYTFIYEFVANWNGRNVNMPQNTPKASSFYGNEKFRSGRRSKRMVCIAISLQTEKNHRRWKNNSWKYDHDSGEIGKMQRLPLGRRCKRGRQDLITKNVNSSIHNSPYRNR